MYPGSTAPVQIKGRKNQSWLLLHQPIILLNQRLTRPGCSLPLLPIMTSLSDFFKPVKITDSIDAEAYTAIAPYVKAIEVSSYASYQSVYIIDYYKRGFIYVSDNPLFLCGNKPSVVQKLGYLFYLKYVPEEDLQLLLEINQAGFSFYHNIPAEQRMEYHISYDFRLLQPNKRTILINHKLSPLVLDRNSNMWLALCNVSMSSNDKPGNIIIRRLKSNMVYQYDIQKKSWTSQPARNLTLIEKEILMLSSQGFTMKEMSDRLFISASTVKFHRIKIFKKLQVKNISEAIACAANYKLF